MKTDFSDIKKKINLPPMKSPGRPKKGSHRERLTKWAAAKAAGMTKRQMATALRLASIPKDIFESLIESDNTPSIRQLEKLGMRPFVNCKLGGHDPKERAKTKKGLKAISDFIKFCENADYQTILRGVSNDKLIEIKSQLFKIIYLIERWEREQNLF